MKKINLILTGLVLPVLMGCDLQPKILSLPDTVGDFISARYPALLADPNTSPEIYESAATDYGVYASPNLYGTYAGDDSYVMYASVDDYIVPPQSESDVVAAAPETDDYLSVPMYGPVQKIDENTITVAKGDTMYSLAKKYGVSVDELAEMNNLTTPYILSVGQRLSVPAIHGDTAIVSVSKTESVPNVIVVPQKKPTGVQTQTRVALSEIKVAPGDTLYSISRKYSVPVNDLAVMNNLNAPFALSVGQVLKVPDLANAPVQSATKVATSAPKAEILAKAETDKAPVKTEQKKISSDPTKKLPKIGARSSSKFSWPVRGKILSHYGAKTGGLFNDGINIGASVGAPVKAAENGVVAYAGNEVKGMGNLVIIQHSDGWMTVYAHMDSMNVRRGARVNVGQQIGTVGETGKVDKPQLHFEIRKGTKAYNPSSYLK